MQVKMFYSAPVFSNRAKVTVISENNELYSELVADDGLNIEYETSINFHEFEPSQIETEDYPIALNLSKEEAISLVSEKEFQWLLPLLKPNGPTKFNASRKWLRNKLT